MFSASFGILQNILFPHKILKQTFESSQGDMLQGQDTYLTYLKSCAHYK